MAENLTKSRFGGVPVESEGGSRFGGIPLDAHEAVIKRGPVTQKPTTGQRLVGSAEAVGSLFTDVLTGAPNAAIGGLRAIADAVGRGVTGQPDPLVNAGRIVEESQFLPSYSPQTEAGQQTRALADTALNWLFSKPEELARFVQDAQINYAMNARDPNQPYVPPGAALPTAIQMLPDLAGTLAGGAPAASRMAARGADVRGARQRAGDLGVDLRAPVEAQAEGLQATAGQMRGEGMANLPQVGADVRSARSAESARIGEIFREGAEGGATLPTREVGNLAGRVRNSLEGMTFDDLPTVNRALSEIENLGLPARGNLSELMGIKGATQTPLNDIMELRKSINRDLPSDTLGREYKALTGVRQEIDQFLQDAFDNDMLNGSPEALRRWKEGFSEWREFKTLFDDDNTIRKIWQEELNPEQVKRLIFNKDAVGAKASAANTVRTLKQILGEDSDAILALRTTALDDILAPALGKSPDLAKAATRWDKFKKDNPTLAAELFGTEGMQAMDDFALYADSVGREMKDKKIMDLDASRMVSVISVGSGLARKAAAVSGVRNLLDWLGSPGREKRRLSDVVGYDIGKPLIPATILTDLSALETARGEEQ